MLTLGNFGQVKTHKGNIQTNTQRNRLTETARENLVGAQKVLSATSARGVEHPRGVEVVRRVLHEPSLMREGGE